MKREVVDEKKITSYRIKISVACWLAIVWLASGCNGVQQEHDYDEVSNVQLLSSDEDSLIIQKIKNGTVQDLAKSPVSSYETLSHKWFLIDSLGATKGTKIDLMALFGDAEQIQLHYYDTTGVYRITETGALLSGEQKSVNLTSHAFTLNGMDLTKPLVLRLQKSSVQGMLLANSKFYFKNEIQRLVAAGLVVGILVYLCLFNLYFYFITKNKSQLVYPFIVFFFAINSLYVMQIPGINFRPEFIFSVLSFNKLRLHTADALINGLFVLLYCLSFLTLPKKSAVLSKILYGLMAVQVVLLMVVVFIKLEPHLLRIIIDYWMPLLIMTALGCGVNDYLKGNKIALYYVLGYSLFAFFVLVDSFLQVKGIGYPYSVPVPFLIFGFLSEAIFLNIGLVRKIEWDKQQAQLERIEMAENQKVLLEKTVKERTWELVEKQDEILAQNEELTQMAEQLSLQRDDINKQKKIIEAQNAILAISNADLEKRVQERTDEIQKAHKSLVSQNTRLEQFTFMTAHNIRGPIARLLGLTNIFNNSDLTDKINVEIISRVKESANDLDSIVREIGNILQIQKGDEEPLRPVLVCELIRQVLKNLAEQISEEGATVEIRLDDSLKVLCVQPYLHSIFYNTISNSLKYKKPTERLNIIISHRVTKGYSELLIEDNGLGLDLEKYNEKVFKPYTRFHSHKEGRGLGMYLTKIQMEAMDGEVQIRSRLNEGLTTILRFKLNI